MDFYCSSCKDFVEVHMVKSTKRTGPPFEVFCKVCFTEDDVREILGWSRQDVPGKVE